MLGEFTKILGFTGSATAIVILTLALFWKGDEAFSDTFKKQVAEALINFRIKDISPNWTAVFIKIFDNVFGVKHFSIKCFSVSSLLSIFLFFTSILLFYSISIGSSSDIEYVFSGFRTDDSGRRVDFNRLGFFLSAVSTLVIMNFIGDYISLLVTRYILKLAAKNNQKNLRLFAYLITDFILSMIVFILFFLFYWFYSVDFHLSSLLILMQNFMSVLTVAVSSDLWLSMATTTMLTSVWLWVYLAGLFALRASLRLRPVLNFFQHALEIEKKPIRSIGVSSSFVMVVFFSIVAVLKGLF